MKKKQKICFVVDTLANHGAERYLFEILKSINNRNFECTVFVIRKLENSFEKHYYKYISDLGVNIIEYEVNIFRKIKIKIFNKILTSFTYRILNFIDKKYIKNKIDRLFLNCIKNFDKVIIIKWEVYFRDRHLYDMLENKFICVLSSLAQYLDNPYKELPKSNMNFILMYKEQEQEIMQGMIDTNRLYNFFTFPLVIDNNDFEYSYNPIKKGFRIGVFSRIHYDQPTIFVFFLLHLLHSKGYKDVEIYFYGRYLDTTFYNFYNQTIKHLKINGSVFFKGHSFDIKQTIFEDQISMGIMNNINGFIGYSSIELLSFGLPVLFFNIDSNTMIKENNLIIHNDINSLADEVIYYKNNSDKLGYLSKKLFEFAKNKYNINNYIKHLENYFDN